MPRGSSGGAGDAGDAGDAGGAGEPVRHSPVSLDAAFGLLERAVEAGAVPGAAAAVGTVGGTLRRAHFGFAELQPERRPLRADALFDVASLTKVVVGATLTLRLVERGELFLNQSVSSIVPELGTLGRDEITVRQLLAHTSGLPSAVSGWRAPYSRGETERAPIWELICRQPLRCRTGSTVQYSDIGYFTLGVVLARAGGAPLDSLARREVFEPLGMRDTDFLPSSTVRERVVATEHVAGRGGTIAGTVHDEMAAAAGGVAAHAGLFSTGDDLERFCRAWLGKGNLDGRRFLSPASVAVATRDQTGGGHDASGTPSRHGLGWMLQPNPRLMGAELCSPAAYGHTGFTGTSLVIDPGFGIWVVLLTNRVHPSRTDGSLERVNALRARFHNLVVAALAEATPARPVTLSEAHADGADA